MPIYRSKGQLTGVIETENVPAAQEYLREDRMVEYVSANAKLEGVLEWIEWSLHANGHDYHVTAVTNRPLDADELKRLASEVSGQNSDGLGESFEQQAFAEQAGGECGECDDCENGYTCYEDTYGGMISFDWKTNDSAFELV